MSVFGDMPPEREDDPLRADRCWVCAGKGTRSSWINKLGREVEGRCPDCNGTGRLSREVDANPRYPSEGA
jgi:DnaJ-class molecular chaperone